MNKFCHKENRSQFFFKIINWEKTVACSKLRSIFYIRKKDKKNAKIWLILIEFKVQRPFWRYILPAHELKWNKYIKKIITSLLEITKQFDILETSRNSLPFPNFPNLKISNRYYYIQLKIISYLNFSCVLKFDKLHV